LPTRFADEDAQRERPRASHVEDSFEVLLQPQYDGGSHVLFVNKLKERVKAHWRRNAVPLQITSQGTVCSRTQGVANAQDA
jgi:hypothetical protein